jgi:hypothetical protein
MSAMKKLLYLADAKPGYLLVALVGAVILCGFPIGTFMHALLGCFLLATTLLASLCSPNSALAPSGVSQTVAGTSKLKEEKHGSVHKEREAFAGCE